MVLSGGCINGNHPIETIQLDKIKKNYSPEVINYFYEIAFYQDYVGPIQYLSKWKNDIKIGISGDLWVSDKFFVQESISQINQLNLPIKLLITADTTEADLMVYFGDNKNLRQKLNIKSDRMFKGIGTYPSDYIIRTAKIGIANDAKSYHSLDSSNRMMIRQSIILEEIVQILGLPGDSWMYPNSVFFEGKHKDLVINKLDGELIQLLYKSGFPTKYSREQFEKDFKDVLNFSNVTENIIHFVTSNNIKLEHLEYIHLSSFNDDRLFKFPGHVFVNLEGDFLENEVSFCEQVIDEINGITNDLKLELGQKEYWQEYPSLTIQFIRDPLLQSFAIAERFLSTDNMMISRRVKGTIKFRYIDSGIGIDQKQKKLLFNSIYKILGFDHAIDDPIEIDSVGVLRLRTESKEIFSLFYNPIFPSGMYKVDLDNAINSLR